MAGSRNLIVTLLWDLTCAIISRGDWLYSVYGSQSQILRWRPAGLARGGGLPEGGAGRAPHANPAHRDGLLEIARRRPVLAALDLVEDRHRLRRVRKRRGLFHPTPHPQRRQPDRRRVSRDPRDIESIWADLYRSFDYQVTGGAEMRALSAIDLALWDLLGKSLDAPVY